MRGTSTVVDATLFVFLVGAAVAVLTLPLGSLPTVDADAADETADVLATSTANITYSLAPGASEAKSSVVVFPRTNGSEFQRTAHGTLTSHLASATLGNLTVDKIPVTHTRADFRAAVANATRNATRTRDHRTQISTLWEPYEGAPIRGIVRIGPTPPPAADVHVARLTVASGLPATRSQARTVARNGNLSDVGDFVATNVVRGLFPPETTRAALLGGYPVEQLVTHRYERFGLLVGTRVGDDAVENNVTGANAKLSDRLGERLTADMRARFDSPSAAAASVTVDTVHITVRTWSP